MDRTESFAAKNSLTYSLAYIISHFCRNFVESPICPLNKDGQNVGCTGTVRQMSL
jgi:hypothetical protein